MLHRKNKKVMLGALVGSLLGTLSSLVMPKKKSILSHVKEQTSDWSEKAKDISSNLLNEIGTITQSRKEISSKRFLSGMLIGLAIGAGSGLLLAPKSGKQLRKDLTNGYQEVSDSTSDIIDYINENINHHPIAKKIIRKAKLKKHVNGAHLIKKVKHKNSEHAHQGHRRNHL